MQTLQKISISIISLALGLHGQAMFFGMNVGTGGGGGGFAIVSHTSQSNGTGAAADVETGPITTTGANSCYVAVSAFAEVVSTDVTITDTLGGSPTGNVWSAVPTSSGPALGAVAIFQSKGLTVGANHRFKAAGGSYSPIAVLCVSGSLISATYDQAADHSTSGSASTIQAGTVTPTNSAQLVLSAVGLNSSGTLSIDSGFTIIETVAYAAALNIQLGLAYQIQTSAVSVNPTWTNTLASAGMMAQSATFKSH